MTRKTMATVDPPSVALGGVSGNRAPVALGQEPGVVPGFTNPTAWDSVCGQHEEVTDLSCFLDSLADPPELGGAAFLRAFSRLRDELDRIPEDSELASPVVLNLKDAAVLARWMLHRVQ